MADAMAQLKTQAVGEWEAVGDCFFSRELLYDMAWGDFDPEDKRLACAPFGGPIAAIRDERRIVLVSPSGPGPGHGHGPTHAPALGGGGGGGGGGGSAGLAPVLRTFTASGSPLGAAVWGGGRLVGWGWSEEQQLVTVEASGKVTVLSPFLEKLREFSFGAEVEREGVAAAAVYGSGVVVVTQGQQGAQQGQGAGGSASASAPSSAPPARFWAVTNLRDPRPAELKAPPPSAYGTAPAAASAAPAASSASAASASASAGGGGGGGGSGLGPLGGAVRPGLPACLAVLEPRHSLSSGLEVLAVVGGVLWQLDDVSATPHPLPQLAAAAGDGGGVSATAAAVSPDGAFVALFTTAGRLVVLSADLTRQLTDFETSGVEGPPTGLHWVGSDAVLLTWPDAAVLVGPYGDSVQWSCPEGITAVIPEVDGCRLLLGRGRHELLRKVPEPVVQVFRPGATGPAAALWEARALYDDTNPACERLLRNIQDSGPAALPTAVATCIQAAAHDLSPPRQRALLRAAAYGRPFCPPSFPRHLLYGTACRLRLLGAVREARVGLPLSAAQLEALGLPVLVARLISYRQWLLAYRIAGTLRHVPGAVPPPTSAAAAAASSSSGPGGSLTSSSSSRGAGAAAPPGALSLPLPPGGLSAPAYGYGYGYGYGAGGAGGGGGGSSLVLGQEAVLLQWAAAKISAASGGAGGGAGADDVALKDSIVAKLKGCPGVRYAPLAAHALSVGRRRLALRLLDEERSAAAQVPLLLRLATGAAGAAGQGAGRGGGARQGGRAGAPAPPESGDDDEGEGPEEVLQRALRKAVESGDTDLVYHVLFGLYRHRPLPEFWALTAGRALPRNLFFKYCRAKDPALLEEVLTVAASGLPPGAAAGSPAVVAAASAAFPPPAALAELAGLQLRQALAEERRAAAAAGAASASGAGGGGGGASPAAVESAATRLAASLADVAHKYGQGREWSFQARAATELASLRREQARLERETGQRLFWGLSLVDTVRLALRLGHSKAAAALKKQFSVTDRRFAWIKVRTLAEARDWEGLEGYASELRRSPIGWEPWVEAAKKWGAPLDYTARLVSRLPDSPAKAEELSGLGLAREAAEVAARIKDSDLFARIQSAVAAGSPAAAAVAQIRERFQSTFR